MESDAAVVADHFFYNQGGVQLSLGSHVPLLTYHSHDHEIRRRLKPGKPTRTSGSFTEDDVGLQVFYDVPLKGWVICHTRPRTHGESSQEWTTDTIYMPDVGSPYIKQGFSPVKPGKTMWNIFMAVLLTGSLTAVIVLWAAMFFRHS